MNLYEYMMLRTLFPKQHACPPKASLLSPISQPPLLRRPEPLLPRSSPQQQRPSILSTLVVIIVSCGQVDGGV